MDAKQLIELRKQAEKAVAEMPSGEMKVKAFEVILSHLLSGSKAPAGRAPVVETKTSKKSKATTAQTKSTPGRILVLRDEGFFNTQRTISEVREELGAHGWHYPLTTLSGTLQALVRKQELRRIRATAGKKKIWKYSNP